jgi:nuclear GTP-binding protein
LLLLLLLPGSPPVQAAARIVLQDWTQGRIPYYTLPPQQRPNQQHESAEVVSSWAAEFDADR